MCPSISAALRICFIKQRIDPTSHLFKLVSSSEFYFALFRLYLAPLLTLPLFFFFHACERVVLVNAFADLFNEPPGPAG